jgi:hypothetical protein
LLLFLPVLTLGAMVGVPMVQTLLYGAFFFLGMAYSDLFHIGADWITKEIG